VCVEPDDPDPWWDDFLEWFEGLSEPELCDLAESGVIWSSLDMYKNLPQ